MMPQIASQKACRAASASRAAMDGTYFCRRCLSAGRRLQLGLKEDWSVLTGCWCSSMSKMPACTARRASANRRRQLGEAELASTHAVRMRPSKATLRWPQALPLQCVAAAARVRTVLAHTMCTEHHLPNEE